MQYRFSFNCRWKLFGFVVGLVLMGNVVVVLADQTTGSNSPIIKYTRGDVHITYQATRATRAKRLPVLSFSPPRNTDNPFEGDTDPVKMFNELYSHNGEIVYFSLSQFIGTQLLGVVGYDDIIKDTRVKAGFVSELKEYDIDSFGGDSSNYSRGYYIESKGSVTWAAGSRRSLLLLPDKGNAFFDTYYAKNFSLKGLARIKISSLNGMQWIEIYPVLPVGDLQEAYDEIVATIRKAEGQPSCDSTLQALITGNCEYSPR